LTSCSGGTYLKTEHLTDASRIQGTYTLILYRTDLYEKLKTVAFLDVKGDEYSLVPAAPQYDYAIVPNVQAADAVEQSVRFIQSHRDYKSMTMKRIVDANGTIIAFELRPLYLTVAYGVSDVLTVDYLLREDGTVRILIDIVPSVKSRFHRDGAGD
jgi:hypothetical protein